MDFSSILVNVKDWVMTALSGVSITTVIGLVIYAFKSIKNLKKNGSDLSKVLSEKLENAINAKVIPNSVKIDITSAVNRELSKVVKDITEHQAIIEKKDDAILKILSKGTIFASLPASERNEILSLIGETAVETTDLEIHLSTPDNISEEKIVENTEEETRIFVR